MATRPVNENISSIDFLLAVRPKLGRFFDGIVQHVSVGGCDGITRRFVAAGVETYSAILRYQVVKCLPIDKTSPAQLSCVHVLWQGSTDYGAISRPQGPGINELGHVQPGEPLAGK